MSLYSYTLPEANIAQKPAVPRDSAKLLVYETKTDTVHLDRVSNLPKYLPKDSFLVMNETKVVPSRVFLQKDGEPMEMLILPSEIDWKAGTVKAIANRRLRNGNQIPLTPKHILEVIEDTQKAFTFKAHFDLHELTHVLQRIGHTPIPNYIQKSPLTEHELRKKYQTVFAKKDGSVAAPTASLHFTERLFKKLENAGIEHRFVTLHVGLGTFAPVLPEHLEQKKLYEEKYEIAPSTIKEIEALRAAGKKCTAVGTTTTRTLESYAKLGAPSGPTDLFIFPPYEFQLVDQLMTNFHLPNSSLMMLVEAFLQHKGARRHLKDLYAIALQNEFRFYSFGDSMLII